MSTKVEQNHPAQPLSSWASQRMVEGYYDEDCFGFSKREAVFLEFYKNLLFRYPDEIAITSECAKLHTKQYFKTLWAWNND
jgi:hypothetical protein